MPKAFLKSVDGKLDANLTEFGVASNSPLAVALKSNAAHAREPAAASQPRAPAAAESVSDMKSKLFQLDQAGFKDGAFCKHGGQVYQVVAVTEAGMEVSKWKDGARAVDSEWVDAKVALDKYVAEKKGVQEISKVTVAMLPTNTLAADASKAAAMLGLLSKAKKYGAANHASLDLLCRPTAVVTKRKFDAMELKIVELTLSRRLQYRRGQSGSSPTAHATSSNIFHNVDNNHHHGHHQHHRRRRRRRVVVLDARYSPHRIHTARLVPMRTRAWVTDREWNRAPSCSRSVGFQRHPRG